MPFDDTSLRSTSPLDTPIRPASNTLTAIGLTAISAAVVAHHKAKVVADFIEDGGSFLRERRQWQVDNNQVYWQDMPVGLKSLARRPLYSNERHSAPAAIISLGKSVQRRIKGATFTMEYFYTDPILHVLYTDSTGYQHKDCLGIWDQGEVVALASGTVKPRWFGILVDWLRR